METQPIVGSDDAVLSVPRRTRVARTFLWIGTIWILGWAGMIASGAISWTDPVMGAMISAVNGLITSPFFLIFTLPLGLIGWAIGSWGPLRKRRLTLSLILPAIAACASPADALVSRFNPGRRFTSLTKVTFPTGAKILESEFEGGGFADFKYTYVFNCPAEETDRLIRELKLTRRTDGETSLGWSSGVGSRVGGQNWTIDEVWYAKRFASDEGRVGNADFIEIQTDATHTRVRLICGTI